MTQIVEQVTWTIHDLEVLHQSEGKVYEIIQGELFVTRTPHRRHQQICLKIAALLDLWAESTGLGATIISPGITLSEEDNVIPDVVWISHQRLKMIEDESGHLTSVPELVIEVLSAGVNNERRDKEAKLKLYSQQGVQEYWIVDRFLKQVQVYRREKARLILTLTLWENDALESPLLPSFTATINRFFPTFSKL